MRLPDADLGGMPVADRWPPGALRFARAVGWAFSFGALLLVVAIYDRLPDVLPVTRWSVAPRSVLVALRIPAINLLMVVVVDVLYGVLARSPHRGQGALAVAALYVTAGLKSVIAAAELFAVPMTFAWAPAVTLAVVAVGVGIALAQVRSRLDADARSTLVFTTRDRWVVVASVAGIAWLQVAPFA